MDTININKQDVLVEFTHNAIKQMSARNPLLEIRGFTERLPDSCLGICIWSEVMPENAIVAIATPDLKVKEAFGWGAFAGLDQVLPLLGKVPNEVISAALGEGDIV